MRNPWFPFHTNDWLGNANLKRCSHEEKGIWVDILCLMNDSDTPGCLKWTLKEIAKAVGTKVDKVKKLAEKGVIKGSDDPKTMIHFSDFFAQKNSKPIEILIFFDMPGPLWYSSRMVRDHYLKIKRGANGIKSLANPNVPRSKIDKDTQLLIDKVSSSPSLTDADADADIKTDVFIKKNTKRKIEKIDLPDFIDEQDWSDFLQHRKDSKSPMSTMAQNRAITILSKLTTNKEEAKEIINNSIANGWKGLFPIKQNNNKNGDKPNGRNKESSAKRHWDSNIAIIKQAHPELFADQAENAGPVYDGEIVS